VTAEEHLKVIIGDLLAHLTIQIATSLAERDRMIAERDALLKRLAEAETLETRV